MKFIMTIAFLSAVLRGVWAIEPQYAENAKPFVHALLSGKAIDFKYERKSASGENENPRMLPYAIDASGKKIYAQIGEWGQVTRSAYDQAPAGSTAVISIIGPVIKYDYCGDAGTNTLSQRVKTAEAHQNINSIILFIDSPGGMVDGTATFSDVIKNSKKPVVAFIDDGMAASAAYWIASSAKEIIASQPLDNIGSIGAYTTLADYTGAYEKEGIKIKTVYAPQSSEKNEETRQAFEKDNLKPAEQFIGKIAAFFIETVKKNRDGKLDVSKGDPFKGKLFDAMEALQIGLIDHIGNFEFAHTRAQALAKEKEKFTLKFKS